MNVYLLGNGFDLAHGLNTSFVSFRNHLFLKQSILLDLFDGYDYWTNFEENVCKIDHKAYRVLTSTYGSSIPNFVQSLYDDVKDELIDFLDENDFKCKKVFSFNTDDYFLNFNYTPTLVETYDIEPNQIYHIHGSLFLKKYFGLDEDIILGHDSSDYSYNPNLLIGRFQNEYRQFVKYTVKPVRQIINSAPFRKFLDKCKNAEKIIVYGLGYGSVDMHYIR